MNSSPSIIVMTGDGLRHRFFVNHLIKNLNIIGVVFEMKSNLPRSKDKESNEIITQHFRERDETEERYFGSNDKFFMPSSNILEVQTGESNSPAVAKWINKHNPDYIILYGTSIIRDPLLSLFKGRIINMHLGLSPYYRGAGTNFWPLVNREPECVGATIHLAVLEVDSGPILAQVRPNPEVKDRCHDLGCKTIIAGTELMPRCLLNYHCKKLIPKPQTEKGYLYRKRDFNAQAVKKMWHNFETGMMQEYLQNMDEKRKKFPIIEI